VAKLSIKLKPVHPIFLRKLSASSENFSTKFFSFKYCFRKQHLNSLSRRKICGNFGGGYNKEFCY